MDKSKDTELDFLKDCDMVVPSGAFIRDANRSALSNEAVGYNARVAELCGTVEELDRHDDFAVLKIDPEKYVKDGGVYGIEYRPDVHLNGSVIQPHQQRAAADFLKRLRGFGMLADVVGSGKTFEACVVLSELAVRGVVQSMLIIAPDQVYAAWKETLEQFFGLGIGSLCEIRKLTDKREDLHFRRVGSWLSPDRPLLVRWDDFIEWREDEVINALFDVIVVDEAHHLCDQSGRDANALKLLSHMMQSKKKAQKEYCLLLSATPHDGNLENMFPLWYFIDSKGGIPDDFGKNVSEAVKSEQYRRNKARYKNYICHGATTVMEFINRVKFEEVFANYKAEFVTFMRKKDAKLCDAEGLLPEFKALPAGEKYGYIQSFLTEKANAEISAAVNAAVALAYHEGILRQIMIRQPNTFQHKKKIIKNFYFYPVESYKKQITLNVFDQQVRYRCDDLDGEGAVVLKDGSALSVREFIRACTGAKSRYGGEYSYYQAEFLFNSALMEASGGCSKQCGFLSGAADYYKKQFLELTYFEGRYDICDRLVPVACGENGFARKFAKTLEILREHKDRRVLVFFDYSYERDKQLKGDYGYTYGSGAAKLCLADKFAAELKKLPEFADRILSGDDLSAGDRTLEKQFEAKKDAVLIVTDAQLTEGANLQSCNVIINFQVTSDPLSMDQRIGRVFRIKQENDVTVYSLADMNELEGYVLAYFTRIGLMTSNSGDATIISGSNNEHMVTLRCKQCGNVRLLTQDDYNTYKERDGGVWCAKTDLCRTGKKGTLMREMNVHDFQCGTCKTTFSRAREKEGYKCIYDDTVSMCSNGQVHDRDIYCRKICVMSHCARFSPGGALAACPALAVYRANGNVGDQDLMLACAGCKLRSECPRECRVGQFVSSIEPCLSCMYRTGGGASMLCSPHVLEFDENWEADCPRCARRGKKGKIRPRIARTFDAFINGLYHYSQKGDDNFCETLEKESAKVAEIQKILAMDRSEEDE